MEKEILSQIIGPQICPTIVLIKNGCVLQGMRNYTPDKWKAVSVWTTPGGRADEGETVEAALRRETFEEVGFTDFEVTGFVGKLPGAKEGDEVWTFIGTTEQDPELKEPEKFSEWKWVPLSEYMAGSPYNEMNPVAHQAICEHLKRTQL